MQVWSHPTVQHRIALELQSLFNLTILLNVLYILCDMKFVWSQMLPTYINVCITGFSVLCRCHYPHGNLSDFLQHRVQQLTEISLHKITLDVASGLEYLHQRHLVHNGLAAHSVYMNSVSEVNIVSFLSHTRHSNNNIPARQLVFLFWSFKFAFLTFLSNRG